MIPLPIGKRYFKNRSLPASAQNLINYYPETLLEDGKERFILHSTPGSILFGTIGNGPIHGMKVMNGVLYVVSGSSFYSVNSAGTGTLIGPITGNTRVSMAHNGTQMCITNSANGYTYSVSAGLAKITDVDYLPGSTVIQNDGYFIFPKDNTGDWFISSLLDGTAYDSLDYGTTYGDPDNVLTVIADQSDVFVFGQNSIEIKYNSGNADFPYSHKGIIERGCSAKYTPQKMDNTIYWLGDDKAVYRMNGYVPQQISDSAIEYAIQGYTDVSDAFAYTYSEEGHKFYVLTFPTGNATFVYDAMTGVWHQRAYRVPLSNDNNRHRANCYQYCYGKHLVGDFENGKIYQMDLDTYTDNGDPLVSTVVFPPFHQNGARFSVSELYVDIEPGNGLANGQGSDPQAMLQESRDGTRTWSSEVFTGIGKRGVYENQARWRRRGAAMEYTPSISISDPVKRTLLGAYIR